MQSCELIMAISTLACWIAQDRTVEEIRQISNIYRILSQTLDAISNQEFFCNIITNKNAEDSDDPDGSDNTEDSDDSDDSEDSNSTDAYDCDCSEEGYDCDDFYDSKNPDCY